MTYPSTSPGIFAKLTFQNISVILSGKAEYWLSSFLEHCKWACGAHSRRDCKKKEWVTVPLKKCHHSTTVAFLQGSKMLGVGSLKEKWLFVEEDRGDRMLAKGHPWLLCRGKNSVVGAYCSHPIGIRQILMSEASFSWHARGLGTFIEPCFYWCVIVSSWPQVRNWVVSSKKDFDR